MTCTLENCMNCFFGADETWRIKDYHIVGWGCCHEHASMEKGVKGECLEWKPKEIPIFKNRTYIKCPDLECTGELIQGVTPEQAVGDLKKDYESGKFTAHCSRCSTLFSYTLIDGKAVFK